MVYLTCAVIGLGGRGVIKTWTEVAARVCLYMLTCDLTSLVPPQIRHRLQVRKVGIAYFFFLINLASLVFLSNSDLDLEHSNRIDMVRPTKLGLVSNLIAAWRKTPEVYTARN